MNYMAQFAYCDSRVPPIGGHRRMTKFSDVLDAVRWQQRAIEKAAELSSWEARLDGTGENARAQHNEAHRIAERQRWADLKQRQTSHSSGNLMQREGFDSVYSEVHANKDTFSVLTPGSLVPSIDPRVPKIDPSALRSKDRPLLPTRRCVRHAVRGCARVRVRAPSDPSPQTSLCRDLVEITMAARSMAAKHLDFRRFLCMPPI